MPPFAIEVKNLKFQYPNQSQLILDIEKLEITKASTTFLQGPSGSGKSTLLNILAGVLPFKEGTVNVLGKDLKTLTAHQKDTFRADSMGFIFQMLNLIPYLSVQENILLPLGFSNYKAQNPKDLNNLIDKLRIPTSYLSKKVTELSVGQQQRVAVARALIGKPAIIIADEPTSSLDYEARDAFLKLLFDQVHETKSTLIFVSHDISLKSHFENYLELKCFNRAFKGEVI